MRKKFHVVEGLPHVHLQGLGRGLQLGKKSEKYRKIGPHRSPTISSHSKYSEDPFFCKCKFLKISIDLLGCSCNWEDVSMRMFQSVVFLVHEVTK